MSTRQNADTANLPSYSRLGFGVALPKQVAGSCVQAPPHALQIRITVPADSLVQLRIKGSAAYCAAALDCPERPVLRNCRALAEAWAGPPGAAQAMVNHGA